MGIHRYVPDAQQRFERADVIEMTVGQDNRGWTRFDTEALRRDAENFSRSVRQTGVNEDPTGRQSAGRRVTPRWSQEVHVDHRDAQPRYVNRNLVHRIFVIVRLRHAARNATAGPVCSGPADP